MDRKKLFLKEYAKPSHILSSTELWFDIHEDFCRVKQRSHLIASGIPQNTLKLDGETLKLISCRINEKSATVLTTEKGIEISELPGEFWLEIETEIYPQKNTRLEGLYKSSDYFCTQCEAQGFRHITYFMDRPDVMSIYTVHIEADREKYPILLSNGDRIAEKTLPNGRHQVSWHDPFKKPCYLFALVAGNLGVLRDQFITQSGKKVALEIYSPHKTQNRCQHAMDSLKKSMKWDEERYGREYDLSTFMILAVDDFNMGAMENKGLNIFNSRLIYADPQTATDFDYFNIESVVGHEYLHNWTGNRVTVRDWFHLSLKEGLTVFRDQEFSGDMSSREMVRIRDVANLRARQFPEDAGPNAHPIRPLSCYAVDNFYTATIYEKGSEVIRMMQTMVGRPGFRKGMDLYFSRHDGQAVIIEDFAKAISDANNQDWEQFKLWYSQAGTPTVQVQEDFNEKSQEYTLSLHQSCPLSEGEKTENFAKQAFHIPLAFELLDHNGNHCKLQLKKEDPSFTKNTEGQHLLHLKNSSQSWTFSGHSARPHLSLNRQFSAPIHLDWKLTQKDLLFLVDKDSDSFNRWESAQKLLLENFLLRLKKPQTSFVPEFISSISKILDSSNLSEDYRSAFLNLPSKAYLSQFIGTFNAHSFKEAYHHMEIELAKALAPQLLKIYQDLHGKNISSKDPKDFGRRSLKNSALSLLSNLRDYHPLVKEQFEQAQIMTDEQVAFAALVEMDSETRQDAISKFYTKWETESLVLNKWFQTQAAADHPETFKTVQSLLQHKQFNSKNPNRVYALLGAFGNNLTEFHNPQHETYNFMAEQVVELDKANPQVATRIAGSFDFCLKAETNQKEKALLCLERALKSGLSKNTYEIISKQISALQAN